MTGRRPGKNGGPTRGVYWGRFNPPHRGHLEVVKRFSRRYQLTVAIGSSERRNDRRNPFSGAERRAMMKGYLREMGLGGIRVVTLKDGPSLSWAVVNMVHRCRPDVVLLSTERDRLARLVRRKVRVVRFRRSAGVSSTRIRDSIAAGREDWRALTGASVVRWILDHNGLDRVRRGYRIRPRVVRRLRPRGRSARPR